MVSGFPERTEKNICYYVGKQLDIPVNNYGVGGRLLSMKSDLGDSACDLLKKIEYHENDITILFCGTNDCTVNIPLYLFKEFYIKAVENWKNCSKPGSKLVISTILPRTNFI